jgi:hypothetical protein
LVIVGDTPVAGVREPGVNEGSIDGACTTLVRAVRRCFLTALYRLR